MAESIPPDTEERFLRFVDRTAGPDQCWRYIGGRDPKGYGIFSLRGKPIRSNRMAYLLWIGPIGPDLCVCHSCDNPSCCNPAHLWLGTQRENTHDKIAKGRARYGEPFNRARGDRHGSRTKPESVKRGETHGAAKVNDAIVRQIRAEYAVGNTSTVKLAEKFGIHFSTVARIVNRKRWSHVD